MQACPSLVLPSDNKDRAVLPWGGRAIWTVLVLNSRPEIGGGARKGHGDSGSADEVSALPATQFVANAQMYQEVSLSGGDCGDVCDRHAAGAGSYAATQAANAVAIKAWRDDYLGEDDQELREYTGPGYRVMPHLVMDSRGAAASPHSSKPSTHSNRWGQPRN
jgi:hypothetical protein